MTVVGVLVKQTQEAYSWRDKPIDSIPEKHWDDTPDILASNITWQIGHSIISEYYHAILVVTGFDEENTEKINLREHHQKFGYESEPLDLVGTISSKLLKEQLHLMQHKVIKNISGLTLSDLEGVVKQPIKQKHSVASTKFDAISWNIKHIMWHCGQIATIKRVIHGGYDFGLPKRT